MAYLAVKFKSGGTGKKAGTFIEPRDAKLGVVTNDIACKIGT
jgi:hypothetical protein